MYIITTMMVILNMVQALQRIVRHSQRLTISETVIIQCSVQCREVMFWQVEYSQERMVVSSRHTTTIWKVRSLLYMLIRMLVQQLQVQLISMHILQHQEVKQYLQLIRQSRVERHILILILRLIQALILLILMHLQMFLQL